MGSSSSTEQWATIEMFLFLQFECVLFEFALTKWADARVVRSFARVFASRVSPVKAVVTAVATTTTTTTTPTVVVVVVVVGNGTKYSV